MKKSELTINSLKIALIALLMYFQMYGQHYIHILKYLDESVAVVLFGYFLLKKLNTKLEKNDLSMLILMVIVVLCGLASNMILDYQKQLVPIITDLGSCFKVFMAYLGSKALFEDVSERTKKNVVELLTFVFRVYVSVVFVFAILNFVFNLGMNGETRYGIRSFRFIHSGAALFSLMFYLIMYVFTLNYQYCTQKNRRIQNFYVGIALFTWATTLRSLAFIFIIIYVYLLWILCIQKQKFKKNSIIGIVIAVLVLIIGISQTLYYFADDETARAQLLRYGIKTAQRFFPLGSGFATYGTDAAYSYYSKLYIEYGFNYVWGLSMKYGSFASDSYWPAVIGQFGFIGVICMAGVIYCMLREVIKKARGNEYRFLAALYICIILVFTSGAGATFFHYSTVGIVFLMPLSFNSGNVRKEVQ